MWIATKFSKYSHTFFLFLTINVSGLLTLLIFRSLGVANNLLFEQIILTAFFNGAVYVGFSMFRGLRASQILPKVLLASLIFTSTANFGLLNIDRSRSFYVLSWVEKSKVFETASKLDLSKVKSNERLNSEAIQVRLDEHVSRGLIRFDENQYVITKLGRVYLLVAQYAAKIFRLDNWSKNEA